MRITDIESLRQEQAERRSRWEDALDNGPYFLGAVIRPEDAERVKELAGQVRAEAQEHFRNVSTEPESRGIKKILDGMKRVLLPPAPALLSPAAQELMERTSYELLGNTELAAIEMESGLLESLDTNAGPSTVAFAILEGRFELREQTM